MTAKEQALATILFSFNNSLREIETELQKGAITSELYEQQRGVIYSCTILELKLCAEATITEPCLN